MSRKSASISCGVLTPRSGRVTFANLSNVSMAFSISSLATELGPGIAEGDGAVRGLVGLQAPHQRMGEQLVTLMHQIPRLDENVPVGSVDEANVAFCHGFHYIRVVRENDQSGFLSANKKNRKTKCLPALYTNLRVSFHKSGFGNCVRKLPLRCLRSPEFRPIAVRLPEIIALRPGRGQRTYAFGAPTALSRNHQPNVLYLSNNSTIFRFIGQCKASYKFINNSNRTLSCRPAAW